MNLFKVAYKSFLETEKFRFSTRVAWWFQCRVNGNFVVAREVTSETFPRTTRKIALDARLKKQSASAK